MSGNDRTHADGATNAPEPIGTRRATIASEVDAPETVAVAIAPDDTDEIDTRVEGGRVVTTIERETTGGLEATIDDYVVALDVATTMVGHAAADDAEDEIERNSAAEQAAGTDEQHANQTDTDTP